MRPKTVEPDVLKSLTAYDWRRNNVRELRNVVERMIIAADGDTITADLIPAEVRGDGREPEAERGMFARLKADAERDIVRAALERNDWHITRTARELGLADHASLHKIMKRLGIRSDR